MKKSRLTARLSSFGMLILAVLLMSGDHNDSLSVSGTTADIADFFAFQAPDPENMVLVLNMQGLLPKGKATEQAEFDENVLMEFNIDLNNDLKEDVLIQAIRRGDSLYFFGPYITSESDLVSEINVDSNIKNQVKISTVDSIFIEENNGMKFFAGPREDPFFFDRKRFNEYMDGVAPGGFNNPGTDTYAGTNVLSVVIELPKSMLGSPVAGVNPFAPDTPTYSMWVETKRRID